MNNMYLADRILYCISLDNNNPEFLDLVQTRLENAIMYSKLPERYLQNGIDINNSSSGIKRDLGTFLNLIDTNENFMVRTDTFRYSSYVGTYIFEQYLYNKLCSDEHIKSIAFVDTNLLIDDFRKLITLSQSNELRPRLHYSLDFIYNQLLDADFIFWDKFNYNKTDYTISKLYEVLTSRYLNCLGNCFFVSGNSMKEIMEGIDEEFVNVMNCDNHLYDYQSENFSLRK